MDHEHRGTAAPPIIPQHRGTSAPPIIPLALIAPEPRHAHRPETAPCASARHRRRDESTSAGAIVSISLRNNAPLAAGSSAIRAQAGGAGSFPATGAAPGKPPDPAGSDV